MDRMNFVDAFAAWMGKTECPEPFMRYTALSMLAAACGHRIFFEYPYGNRIHPLYLNLYTMLIGPSGCGKSAAIGAAREILDAVDARHLQTGACAQHRDAFDWDCENCRVPAKRYNRFKGRLTNTGLYDLMKTTRRVKQPDGSFRKIEVPSRGQIYIIMDELRHGLGHPQHVDQLMSALTEMAFDDDISEMTRTHGRTDLKNFSVNWLSGTTLDWVIAALDKTMLTAGTFGRLVTVVCDYSPLCYPGSHIIDPNTQAYFDFMVARLDEIFDIEGGAFCLDAEAAKVDERWYMSQELPRDAGTTVAVHSRKHAMSLKLASLLKLAEPNFRGSGNKVNSEQLMTAQHWTEEIIRWQDSIAPAILRGETHSADTYLLNQVKAGEESGVGHSTLLRIAMRRYGFDTERLGRVVRTWEEAGEIRVEHSPRSKGGTRYYYTGKGK